MHRIDAEGNVNGSFSDGDATGVEPMEGTTLSAEWLNDVQENICAVIESQNLPLRKGDGGALLAAIEAIVSAASAGLEKRIKAIEDRL